MIADPMTKRLEHLYTQQPQPKSITDPASRSDPAARPRWDSVLANQLGLKRGMMVLVLWPPPGFMESVGYEIGNYATELDVHNYEYIHSFIMSRFVLEDMLPALVNHLVPDGALWISWPAENSEARKSELTIRTIRELGIANGLLEAKTVKIDENWKAIKFVHDPNRPIPIEIEKRPVLRFGLEEPEKYRQSFQ